MGKCRVKVSHKDFIVESDWKEYTGDSFNNYRTSIGDACLGEVTVVLQVGGNFKFFGVDLLKQCIVTLEIEEDGEDK
jgi:hypothetical protein